MEKLEGYNILPADLQRCTTSSFQTVGYAHASAVGLLKAQCALDAPDLSQCQNAPNF